jgi:hypothetical protein
MKDMGKKKNEFNLPREVLNFLLSMVCILREIELNFNP